MAFAVGLRVDSMREVGINVDNAGVDVNVGIGVLGMLPPIVTMVFAFAKQ